MQEERPVEEEKGAREDERVKRELEEGEGGSQEKKQKVLEQALSSYWDWLPPELQMDVEKKALYALIQDRLNKGFREIHNEMAETTPVSPTWHCKLIFNCLDNPVLLLHLSVCFFSLFHFVVDVSLDMVFL